MKKSGDFIIQNNFENEWLSISEFFVCFTKRHSKFRNNEARAFTETYGRNLFKQRRFQLVRLSDKNRQNMNEFFT